MTCGRRTRESDEVMLGKETRELRSRFDAPKRRPGDKRRGTHHEGEVEEKNEGEERPGRSCEASHKVDDHSEQEDPRKGEGDFCVC